MRAASRVVGAVVLLAATTAVSAAADFPKYTGHVNDFSNVLSVEARTRLEELLRETEAATTAEVAIAIVPSLDGMSVEEYANRLFQEWGIGQKGVDNGVLVLVAPNEREMRIEVGYGLEPVLPDGLAGEIIRTNFLPHFRDDNYAAGIQEGVTRVADIVKKNHVLTAEERAALEESASGGDLPWFISVPFFGLFVGIGFFMVGVGVGSKTGFPLLFGSFFGGMPLLMSLAFGTPFYVMTTLAVMATAFGFRQGRRGGAWITEMRKTGRRGRGKSSGWVMGAGSSSSSGSGSSSSSSGSSFGGGSSGGGGASGRW